MEENQDSYEIGGLLPDGSRKAIYRLPESDLKNYKILGKGGGPIGIAFAMAFKYCPNFYERVIGYTVSEEGIGKMVQELMRERLPDHPQAKSGGFTYTFYEKLYTEEKADNNKIPDGLYRCEKCGEYKGRVMAKDLNWDDNAIKETKKESEEYIDVSCLCEGILYPKCKTNKIHRPISNSYYEESNTIGRWPYFTGMIGCEKCRK